MSSLERIVLHILSGVMVLGVGLLVNRTVQIEDRLRYIEAHGAHVVQEKMKILERHLLRLEERD